MATRKSKTKSNADELVPTTLDQKRRAELMRLGLCTSDHKPRSRKADSRGQCSECCADREDAIAEARVTKEGWVVTEDELVRRFYITPKKKTGRPRAERTEKSNAFDQAISK